MSDKHYNLTTTEDNGKSLVTTNVSTKHPDEIVRLMTLAGLEAAKADQADCGCGSEEVVVVDEADPDAEYIGSGPQELDIDDFSKKTADSISKQKKKIQPSHGDNPLEYSLDEDDIYESLLAEFDSFLAEEVELEETFKKGDIVKPTKGPHANQPHEVIHDFGDGHYNIKPTRLSANQIKYSLGAARAHKSDLVKEEVELDEVTNSVKDQLANIDLSIRDWERRWQNSSSDNPNDMKAPQKIKDLKAQKAALMKKHNINEEALTEEQFDEAAGEKDACYHKVKSRYKVWPSAYASGALVKCRKVGAKNWGNKSK